MSIREKNFAIPDAEVFIWEGCPFGGSPHSEQNLMLGVTMLSHGSPLDFSPSHMAAPGRKAFEDIRQAHSWQNLLELSIMVPHAGVLLPSSTVLGQGIVWMSWLAGANTFFPHCEQNFTSACSVDPQSQSILDYFSYKK